MGWPRRSTVTYSVVMNRSKTSRSSPGSVAVMAGNLLLVARVARQEHARGLARHHHSRLHRHHLAPARELKQGVRGVKARQLLEVLDRREDEQDVAVRVRGQGTRRGE